MPEPTWALFVAFVKWGLFGAAAGVVIVVVLFGTAWAAWRLLIAALERW